MQRESAPLVSIITPCYKGGKYLPFSIASVLQQDFKDFELLLIDDKSPDNTREIMQKEREKSDFDPRIHLLQNEKNLGIVGTRNKALQLTKGKYICFLDQDDLWTANNKLSLQVSYLEQNPQCIMVWSHTDLINSKGEKIGQIRFATSDGEIRSKLLFWNQFCTCAVMIRSEVVKKAGFLDRRYDKVDDYDLWLKSGKYWTLGNIDKVLVAYRKSWENTSSENRTYLHMKRLHLRLVWREFWNYPRAGFALLFSLINCLIPYALAEKIKNLLFGSNK